MDAHQFDALARLLAAGMPRRRLIRVVARGGAALALGALGRARVAAAQQGTVPLGGICTASDQCAPDLMGSPVVCGDNHIAKDGALNCCRETGCCVTDADCCGDRLCAPGSDVCNYCALPPFPTRFPGQPCADFADCVPSVVGSVTCADNGIAKDGRLSCCYEVGGFCRSGGDGLCCGSLRCLDGRCGQPGVTTGGPDPDAPALAAVQLSRLEEAGFFDLLYDRLHPDARAIIPRAAVVGWYVNEFAPLGPREITVTGVRFVSWTWPVTGVTYPGTAEVSYRQPFADGSVVEDVARLVRDDAGQWGWFFGRSRAFVDEQIARYAGG